MEKRTSGKRVDGGSERTELLTESGKLIDGYIINVSDGGVCVGVQKKLRKREFINLMLHSKGHGAPQKRRCQVVWVKRVRRRLYRTGLKVCEAVR